MEKVLYAIIIRRHLRKREYSCSDGRIIVQNSPEKEVMNVQ